MQKLLFVTSFVNHFKVSANPNRHCFGIDESEEINKFLNDGWEIIKIEPANFGGANTSTHYVFAVLLHKNIGKQSKSE